MKVILQKDVPHLGTIGDLVKVKDGYGRNFLLPRGLAVLANESNTRQLNHQKRLAQTLAAKQKAAAEAAAKTIASTPVVSDIDWRHVSILSCKQLHEISGEVKRRVWQTNEKQTTGTR